MEAWTYNNDKTKVSAVFRGGEREWALLWNDESYFARGAVACRASEEYQLKLVNEPISAIRDLLAIYGTDKVRLALLERDEPDEYVLQSIAKFGSTDIRHRLIEAAWTRTSLLISCMPFLPAGCIEKLMSHPNTDVKPLSMDNLAVSLERPFLLERIAELDEVAWSIHFGKSIHLDKTKTRKYETMEL